MENNRKDIRDDEFRVLGTGVPVPMEDPSEARRRKRQGAAFVYCSISVMGTISCMVTSSFANWLRYLS